MDSHLEETATPFDVVKVDSRPKLVSALNDGKNAAVLFHGACEKVLPLLPKESVQLILSSPPYCMGKEYENSHDLDAFVSSHKVVLPMLIDALCEGGSLCWQVGFHVRKGIVTPLDFLVYDLIREFPEMHLRNRIVWTFGHGLHCNNRFSGRHEVVLWFTKGPTYDFNLDAVRVEQKYPGKRHAKGALKGEPSGNPLGKNPGDVWDIPNVKANHVEKTEHPCQFPVGLAHRLVRALSKPGDIVLDPFAGVSSTGVAALIEKRRFVGAEPVSQYITQGLKRLKGAIDGSTAFRPAEQGIHKPQLTDKVAQRPPEFDAALSRLAASHSSKTFDVTTATNFSRQDLSTVSQKNNSRSLHTPQAESQNP